MGHDDGGGGKEGGGGGVVLKNSKEGIFEERMNRIEKAERGDEVGLTKKEGKGIHRRVVVEIVSSK